MPTVRLIEGPVGAGKSTFSAALAIRTQGVHIALDAWFAKLFSPDRPEGDFIPWYIARKERLLEIIWAHSKAVLASGTDVILELGLIQRQQRLDFCRKIIGEGFSLVMYELDAPRDIRRARVQRRNADQGPTFSMIVPDHIFELASNMWEPSDEFERDEYEIEYLGSLSGDEMMANHSSHGAPNGAC